MKETVYDQPEITHVEACKVMHTCLRLTDKVCAWALASVYGLAGYMLRGTECKITKN
jgi:hypothetical protein